MTTDAGRKAAMDARFRAYLAAQREAERQASLAALRARLEAIVARHNAPHI